MPIPVLGAPRYEQHAANQHAQQMQAQAQAANADDGANGNAE